MTFETTLKETGGACYLQPLDHQGWHPEKPPGVFAVEEEVDTGDDCQAAIDAQGEIEEQGGTGRLRDT